MSYTVPDGYEESKKSSLEEGKNNLELFLIRVPKKFNISSLHGVRVEPGRVNDLQVDDALPGNMTASFQLTSYNGQDCDVVPLVQGKKNLKTGQPVNRFLTVTKCYSYESKPSNHDLQRLKKGKSQKVSMPEGLKERFTPFGAGQIAITRLHFYQSPSKQGMPTKTPHQGRLSKHGKRPRESHTSPGDPHLHQAKRRKRDKAESAFITDCTPSASLNGILSVDSLPGSHTYSEPSVVEPDAAKSKKKHRKRKKDNQDDTNSTVISHNGDLYAETFETPKIVYSGERKEKKKKNVSFSQEDSVFMDNSGDFNSLEKRIKQECMDLCDSSVSRESEDGQKTKKKKRKFSSGYHSADTSLGSSSYSSISNDKKKQDEKKEKVKDHSASLVSVDTIPENKKKKKKKTNLEL